MKEDMLTEAALRRAIREVLEEMTGAGELMQEKKRQSRGDKSDGRSGWEGGKRGKQTAKVVKRRKGDAEAEVDAPISDLLKQRYASETSFVSRIVNAMEKAGGHAPIAADDLDISTRQLYRYLNDPEIAPVADELRAGPGPDSEWDVERGVKSSSQEKEAAKSRAKLRSKAREERENQERERRRSER
jgi:hypothetical protein